jgi:CheY-like chemotaxis protein
MKKYRLLIVEDDEDEQIFMKKGFEDSGLFEVVAQLENGKLLFDWLQQHQPLLPDVILSDINMPGMNGYEIVRALKNSPIYSLIPAVITSTASGQSVALKCMSAGAAGFIVKPNNLSAYMGFAEELYTLIEEKRDRS